ncbi:MAG: pyridoxamine 5'-phosphate oxidase family protein [Acidimicrobiia bacterium]|nr:pyridoxamine 5'-phosphate oxidase family protein [Acidimicrobiia bacterium]MDH3397016.1 pyridoxamine 5'-phosphate oxidase family protein [Acidimicrobiia bacterium]
MARKDVSMTIEEARAFLEAGRNLQVATLGSDGYPHLTTVWYVIAEDRITFRSFSRSQRIVNLRRDPRLTVLVEEGNSYDTLRGVMVKGRARLIDDRPTVLETYGRIAAKYEGGGGSAALDPETLELLFGRYAGKNTAVMVELEEVVSWDHRKLRGAY